MLLSAEVLENIQLSFQFLLIVISTLPLSSFDSLTLGDKMTPPKGQRGQNTHLYANAASIFTLFYQSRQTALPFFKHKLAENSHSSNSHAPVQWTVTHQGFLNKILDFIFNGHEIWEQPSVSTLESMVITADNSCHPPRKNKLPLFQPLFRPLGL